ncbi:MAG: response regulator [Anaerolineae bacterium]|nr:response regulator [Anaerolineae bacterium]
MRAWLVVEDEPSIYDVLHTMFQMWGVEGIAYNDGEEAIAFINDVDSGKFRGELPELAVLDIRLPGKYDGVEVGARLRRSLKLRHIAIVLMTAYVLAESQQKECMNASGADDLIRKPLPRPAEFRRRLEAVIEARKAKTAAEIESAAPAGQSAAAPAAEAPPAPASRKLLPGLRRRRSALRPPVLPELDEDGDSPTQDQTKDLPRLPQTDNDTQPASHADATSGSPPADE